MSSWTSAITWTASVLTVAQMNTEVRDHLNFLKGALDILTNSTTADTGDTMQLKVFRATTGLTALSALVTGDTVDRWRVTSDGIVSWGPGGGTAVDTNLYRYAANALATDDQFRVLSTAGVVVIGATGNSALRSFKADGDTQPAFRVTSDGTVHNGPGGSTAPTQVVGTRQTGWTVATGTPSRATYATASVTLPTLAGVVMAIEQDLISHGLIGT